MLSHYHPKKIQSGRFNTVCNRIFGKQFELCRMGKMCFIECNENESLLGGMGGIYIRYSRVEPHWSAFWSNYIDLWSLEKCIAYSLRIFSKLLLKNQSSFFPSSSSHRKKRLFELHRVILRNVYVCVLMCACVYFCALWNLLKRVFWVFCFCSFKLFYLFI